MATLTQPLTFEISSFPIERTNGEHLCLLHSLTSQTIAETMPIWAEPL